MRWTLPTGLLLMLAASAEAQSQASTVQISRNMHDLSWVATSLATTFTLRELGVRERPAMLIGTVGMVGLAKALECVRWCGNPNVNWPAGIALKDAAYDLVLTSASIPVLIGKKHGWKAGVASGAAWVASVFVLRQAKWNSP
jgi:hypothetical protein